MYLDKEKERAMKRRLYQKNLEAYRARSRENKRRQRERRRDEINAYQRKRYHLNRVVNAAKQNACRRKRLPYIGIRAAIRDCERGALSELELAQLVWERFAGLFKTNDTSGGLTAGRRGIYGTDDAKTIEKHL